MLDQSVAEALLLVADELKHSKSRRSSEERDPCRTLATRIGHQAEPRRFGWANYLLAIPGLLGQFKVVPDGFWQEDVGGAVVACPCGEEPLIEPSESAECSCGRFYVYVAGRVMVTGGPKHRPKPRWLQVAESWRAE